MTFFFKKTFQVCFIGLEMQIFDKSHQISPNLFFLELLTLINIDFSPFNGQMVTVFLYYGLQIFLGVYFDISIPFAPAILFNNSNIFDMTRKFR